MLSLFDSCYRVCPPEFLGKALVRSVIVFGIGASSGKSEAGDMQRAELHLSLSGLG